MATVPIDREAVLAGHFLLRHLPPAELKRVAASMVVARHPAQTTIFQKGDQSPSMMAVVRGRVKICTSSRMPSSEYQTAYLGWIHSAGSVA